MPYEYLLISVHGEGPLKTGLVQLNRMPSTTGSWTNWVA